MTKTKCGRHKSVSFNADNLGVHV